MAKQAAAPPPPVPVPSAGRKRTSQSRKANATRYRIMEAAVDCLVEDGYASTSITTIATRAKVSRGAMQFHFPTKRSAMEALIGHLLQRRTDIYRTDFAKLRPSDDLLEFALRAYWKQVVRPEFIALQEMTLASRTDPSLARLLTRAVGEFIRESRAPILEKVPKWREQGERYNLAADFAQYVIDGMAWGYWVGQLDETAVDKLLAVTRNTVLQMIDLPGAGQRPGKIYTAAELESSTTKPEGRLTSATNAKPPAINGRTAHHVNVSAQPKRGAR